MLLLAKLLLLVTCQRGGGGSLLGQSSLDVGNLSALVHFVS
jgi:hypothetical protein